MAKLELHLLGGYEGRFDDDRPLALPTKKAWALLSYLALHPARPLSREHLAALLWGDRFDDQARRSLRQTLYELRTAMGEDARQLLSTTRETVSLNPVEADALRFEALAASGETAHFVEAERLYRGALLEGLEVGDATFDEWLGRERTRFRDLACKTLERLAAHRLDCGAGEAGLETARRLLGLDPYQEGGHRLVMRGLVATGHRNDALKHYQDLETRLRADLDAAPEAETTALRDAIREGHGDAAAAREDSLGPAVRAARTGRARTKWTRGAIAAAFAVLGLGAAVGSYAVWLGPDRPAETASGPGTVAPLPDTPSIAVLPFENLSGDPEQDVFAKGLTEDLTTALSKSSQLLVIARTSVVEYRDKPIKVQTVANELGVRYVLEGSVQRSGDDLRITAQLIDAVAGHHLWSELFNRQASELFAVQDDIVRHVLIGLQVKLTDGEHARVASRGTTNLDAWLLRLQVVKELYKFTRESTVRTRKLLQAAHEEDPTWGRPLGGLAWSYWWEARKGWTDDREEWIRKGIELAERAIEMDPYDTIGYMQLGNLVQLQGDHERAIALREKAVEIAPNDFQANWGLGTVLFRAGESERGVEVLKHAVRLSPRPPASLLWALAQAQLMAEHYEDAIETAKQASALAPDRDLPHIQLAAAYSALGRMEEARMAAGELLRIDPNFTATGWVASLQDYKDRAALDRLAGHLVKAGLPE